MVNKSKKDVSLHRPWKKCKLHRDFISPKLEWLSSRKQIATSAGDDVGNGQHLYTAAGNTNQSSHYESQQQGSSNIGLLYNLAIPFLGIYSKSSHPFWGTNLSWGQWHQIFLN